MNSWNLSTSHLKDGDFKSGGLRNFFEYRDLGIADVSDGQFGAHVIRARPGHAGGGEKHRHDLGFQMVYVLNGWVRFWYEGTGEVLLQPHSCVYQPPGIPHREVEHSEDLQLLEITAPARFGTENLD